MQKVEKFINELIIDFLVRWKEVSLLLLINIMEIVSLSSLFSQMPIWSKLITIFSIIIPMIGLGVWCVIERKPDKKDIMMFVIVVLISLFFGIMKSWICIASVFVAYLFVDDKENMYKWLFIVSTTVFSFHMILVLTQLVPDLPFFRWENGVLVNIRHTFGFVNPNFPMMFLLAIAGFGYLYKGNNKYFRVIFSLAILGMSMLIGHNTNCRTGFIAIAILSILMLFPILVKWVKAKWLYILGFICTIGIVLFLNNDYMNGVLSTRPSLYNRFFRECWPHLFYGHYYLQEVFRTFPNIDLFEYPLDNDFLLTLFDGGILATLTTMVLFNQAFKDNKDTKVVVILIGVFVYSQLEKFTYLFNNPFYVIMFAELVSQYFKNKDKIKWFNNK